MNECFKCRDKKVVDQMFIDELNKAMGQLIAELVIFAKKHKIDHTDMPALAEAARVIRIAEML